MGKCEPDPSVRVQTSHESCELGKAVGVCLGSGYDDCCFLGCNCHVA